MSFIRAEENNIFVVKTEQNDEMVLDEHPDQDEDPLAESEKSFHHTILESNETLRNDGPARKSYNHNNLTGDYNQSLKIKTEHIQEYINNDFSSFPEDNSTNEPDLFPIKEELEWDNVDSKENKTGVLGGSELATGESTGEAEQKENYEQESILEVQLKCPKNQVKKQEQNLRISDTVFMTISNRIVHREENTRISIQNISTNTSKSQTEGKKITDGSPPFAVNEESKMVFECKICSLVCESRHSFSTHLRQSVKCLEHVGDIVSGNYRCNLCGKSFKSEERFKCHCSKHELGYPCKICGKVLATQSSLKYHLKHMPCLKKAARTLVDNKCTDCGRSFKKKEQMLAHFKRLHNKNEEEYKCDDCGKIFRLLLYLQKHIKEVHTNVEVTCDVCKKTFVNKYKLQKHQSRLHSIKRMSLHHGECKCNHCPSTFLQNSNLLDHIKKCHSSPRYKCNLCVEKFHTDKRLKTHMRNVHSVDNRQSYLCFICGKSLTTKEKLDSHLLIHSNEKPHRCEVCGNRFRTTTNLAQHARIHSDVRPFKCQLCNKAFRIKHHLRQHMAVHGLASLPKYGNKNMNKCNE